jgi:hypothetical protein
MDDDLHRHIAEVSREHDRLMARAQPHRMNGNGAHNGNRAGLLYRDNDDAMVAAPVAEEPFDFTEAQFEALAQVIATLRREWEQAVERLEAKILQTMTRLVMPGEIAEQKVYGLNDRLAILERYVERALTQTKPEDSAVATQRAAEIAELRAENRELKAMLGDVLRRLDRQHEKTAGEISDLRARVAVDAERLAEIKADVKSELQTLDAKQDEVMRLYTEIRLVT